MKKFTYIALDPVLTGKRIQQVIRANGYTVRELQDILGLSCPQSVYKWMYGRSIPTVDHLYMMHKLFHLHMEDMLMAVGEEE